MTQYARDREGRLKALITSLDGTECRWGIDDCTAMAAAWVRAELGIDLGLPKYRSREDAARIIAKAGGLIPLWDQYLSPHGISEAGLPALGDIGVIETSRGPVGVIFAHFGAAFWRASAGVIGLSPRQSTILKVWSI